jgi:hypothetical protein
VLAVVVSFSYFVVEKFELTSTNSNRQNNRFWNGALCTAESLDFPLACLVEVFCFFIGGAGLYILNQVVIPFGPLTI